MPLPALDKNILTQPGILTNTALNRSASEYVRMVLQLVLTDHRYSRDKLGTKCNILAEDVLQVMGLPVARKLANDHIMDWRNGKDGMIKMGLIDIVHNANLGCPSVAGLVEEGHGHLMVVLPQTGTQEPSELLIAQAGLANFYGRQMRYGVPLTLCPQVEFFGGQ